MKKYRVTWKQHITKISKPIEATNKEHAKNKWIEQDCPCTLTDLAGEEWVVDEIVERHGHKDTK